MHAEPTCPSWRIPDGLSARMEPFLPKYRTSLLGGRPRLELRKVADGIFYILRTGCQWKAAPHEFGSGSSLHRYFQEWARRHVFHKLWKYLLRRYDALRRHPMEVAKSRRRDHQGSLGRGKKPGQTRQIGASRASSGRC